MFRFKIMRKRKRTRPRRVPTRMYQEYKEVARTLINQRLGYFATVHGFVYQRVAIRDTKRSWGSCSSKGNLNFSYKLLFLPPCIRDYIILHELCHLRVLNHSQAFWDEMTALMPDAIGRAKTLRGFERTHGTAVTTLQAWQQSHECMACHDKLYHEAEISPYTLRNKSIPKSN